MSETIGKSQYREFQRRMSFAITYDLVNDYPNVDGKVWSVRLGQAWPGRLLVPGNYLYALLSDGELRVPFLPHTDLDMHHPQLARRMPVVGAGLFGWTGNDVTYIDNKSGCYTPDSESLYYVSEAMKFYGVPFNAHFRFDNFLHY